MNWLEPIIATLEPTPLLVAGSVVASLSVIGLIVWYSVRRARRQLDEILALQREEKAARLAARVRTPPWTRGSYSDDDYTGGATRHNVYYDLRRRGHKNVDLMPFEIDKVPPARYDDLIDTWSQSKVVSDSDLSRAAQVRDEPVNDETQRALRELEALTRPYIRSTLGVAHNLAELEDSARIGDQGKLQLVLSNLQGALAQLDLSRETRSNLPEELEAIARRLSSAPPKRLGDILSTRHDVDCSVFAPPSVAPGEEFEIQAFLHARRDLINAARLAAQRDPSANRRGFESLGCNITLGSLVELFLESQDLDIAEPLTVAMWSGAPTSANFRAKARKNQNPGPITAVLHVAVKGCPVGEIEFKLSVAPEVTTSPVPMPVGTAATRFSSAFVSYSRKDFDRVSLFAEGLAENGIELFLDVTKLERGDDFAHELPRMIEKADVFYLMWSRNAAESKWVEKESQQAVALHDGSSAGRPRIKPIPLELPWPTLPPHLKKFVFYSSWDAHRIVEKLGLLRMA